MSSLFFSRFRSVGSHALSQFDEDTTIVVIENLGNFGESTAEKRLPVPIRLALFSLEEFGIAAAEKRFEEATRIAAGSLGKVGSTAAENSLEDAAWNAAEFLEAFGKVAMEKDLANTAFAVPESLISVGRITAEKGLETATGRVVKALLAVRQIAKKIVASNIAELTLLSEETVEAAIQDYESTLEEQDRDSYREFMELYEQKLEKLRAKKRQSE